MVLIEPCEDFLKKTQSNEIKEILISSNMVACMIVPHYIASLSYYQSVNGMVIDLNSRSLNIWAVENERVISQLPFDKYEHGIDPPLDLNFSSKLSNKENKVNMDYYLKVGNYWMERMKNIHLSHLPSFIKSKLIEVLESLTTQQMQRVLSCIVISFFFFLNTTQFICSIIKGNNRVICNSRVNN